MARGLDVLLWVPGAVLADLPVHCVRTQIAGRWRFYSSRPTAKPQDCGHHTPGTISDVLQEHALSTISVAFDEPVLELELESPDFARTTGSQGADELGWWTMVYDEGFEVRIKNRAFFAFSSLLQAPRAHTNATQTWTSRCDRTAVGWYRSSERPLAASFGCYYGVQLSPSSGSSSRSGIGDGGSGRSEKQLSSVEVSIRYSEKIAGGYRGKAYSRNDGL
jgi:cathepsin C